MKRWSRALFLLFLPLGCANNVTKIVPPPVMLVSYSVKGDIEQHSDVCYFFVLNASNNQENGPVMQGPYAHNSGFPGWNLPFYRDQRIEPGSGESLRPTIWTDFYQLSNEAGTLVMRHGIWPNPFEGYGSQPAAGALIPSIYPDYARLQRGKDWDLSGGTVTLTIPVTDLGGSEQMRQFTPIFNATNSQFAASAMNINFAIAAADGTPIDYPTVTTHDFVSIPTREGITDGVNSFQVKTPSAIPAGISPNNVNFKSYRVQIKRFE